MVASSMVDERIGLQLVSMPTSSKARILVRRIRIMMPCGTCYHGKSREKLPKSVVFVKTQAVRPDFVAGFCSLVPRFLFFYVFPRWVPAPDIFCSCICCRPALPCMCPSVCRTTHGQQGLRVIEDANFRLFWRKYKLSFKTTEEYDVGGVGALRHSRGAGYHNDAHGLIA